MGIQQVLVNGTLGIIRTDEASVTSAQLQFDWNQITAPIDGRADLKQVDAGNQTSSDDTTGVIVTTQTHLTDLIFMLPENDITTALQMQKSGSQLKVEAQDRTNSQKLSEGALPSLSNRIDATTGAIRVKAHFNNQDDALFPNQFVNARTLVDTQQNVIAILAAALQMGNEGHFVWILNSGSKVSRRLVKPGIQGSQKVVVAAGLSMGGWIVTDRIDRLTEGVKVEVVETHDASVSGEETALYEYGEKGANS